METSIKELMSRRTDLINELVQLQTELEQAWKYHPDNPSGENPSEIYDATLIEIREIEGEIEDIDHSISGPKLI